MTQSDREMLSYMQGGLEMLRAFFDQNEKYQEVNDDLIRRGDAIDEFDGVKVDEENCTEYDIGYNDGIDFAVSRLSVLPSAQPEQGWIPVSERLPEEYEYVLLCDREPGPDECTDYSQMAVGWLEDGQICCWDDRAARKEFVAWMPLPEPYREEKR